jgi:hypothetical protein
MGPVFAKLELDDQPEVAVLNAPLSFEPELSWLTDRRVVRELGEVATVRFALAFAARRAELDALAAALALRADGDSVLWFAYPKRTSRRYRADFDRDHGWELLTEAGFVPVRLVSIDEDWSALRFRHVDAVRTPERRSDWAASERGREWLA